MSGARIAQPETTFNVVPASLKVSNTPHRVLAVGIQSSTATVTEKTLQANIGNDGEEKTLFGYSQLSEIIRNFKKMNKETRIDALSLDEASAASSATSTLTVSGTATANAEIEISIGSQDNTINVVIPDKTSATDIASAIETAITAYKYDLPVTVSSSSTDVTLTSEQSGDFVNDMGVKVVGTIPGVDITVTGFTGGAGTPDFTDLFDAIDGERYQTIIWPFPDDLDDVKDLLEPRWNVKNNVLDGVAITVLQDTHANQLTALNKLNEKTQVLLCNGVIAEDAYSGGMIFETPANIAAQFAGIRALRYTENSVLTQFLTTNVGRDQFGGPGIAALPYFNTLMPYLPTIPEGRGFSEEEVEQLFDAGGSCMGNNITGTDVILGEMVTTYKTDPAGNQDLSFKFLNYVDESSIAREYFWLNVRKRFAQTRLTSGAVLPDRDMTNEGVVRSYCAGLYGDLSSADYAILQAGTDYIKYFKNNLRVTLDLSLGRIIITAKLCYVTQAREFLGTLEMVFDIEGGK